MKLTVSKTEDMAFCSKTNIFIWQYKLCHSSVTRTHSIRDLGVLLGCKLNFRKHVNYIFSQCHEVVRSS
jgi:hypothetical protein